MVKLYTKLSRREMEYNTYIAEATEEGYNKGHEKGYNEGHEQGIEQGIEQGSLQEKNQVAINLLKEKMPYDFISKVTGLTVEEIKKIEKSINQE